MSASNITISIDILERACLRAMNRLRSQGPSIELSNRAYWFVAGPEAYDFSAVPADLAVGELEEDWLRVNALAEDEEVSLLLSLESIAAVLKAVSDSAV